MDPFDVLIIGTGLTESILAAALSKASLRVLHIDESPYYGASEASLSVSELDEYIRTCPNQGASRSGSPPSNPRAYSVALTPSLLPSNGALIKSLVDSGVSRYTSFKLLDSSYIYHAEAHRWNRVPTSKSSIFSSPLPLPQKRKLMRLIQMLASSDAESLPSLPEVAGKESMKIVEYLTLSQSEGGSFGLTEEVAISVAYCLGFCSQLSDETLSALLRIQSYIHSAGRYGDSPFLVGYYGGIGEVAQGFCRMAAVHGSTYILGHKITSLKRASGGGADQGHSNMWNIELEDVPDVLSARLLISSRRHSPRKAEVAQSQTATRPLKVARCIAIYGMNNGGAKETEKDSDQEDQQTQNHCPALTSDKTSLLLLPTPVAAGDESYAPAHHRAVFAMTSGADTMSTPSSHTIVYMQTLTDGFITPQKLFQPYLTAFTAEEPEYAAFYHSDAPPSDNDDLNEVERLDVNSVPEHLHIYPEVGDAHAREAERLFGETIKSLQVELPEGRGMWPPRDDLEDDD